MIKIENETLANYLMFKLDKQENQFTEEELSRINELTLNPIDIDQNYSLINLDIISYFSELKKIYLLNLHVYNTDIEKLSRLNFLDTVYFEKCEFEDADLLHNLRIKEIELINCDIQNYNFVYQMNDLKSLSIINGNISVKGINNLKNLNYLQLSYSNINGTESFNLPLLQEMHIDNTNIVDLSSIKSLKYLKRIGISEEQYVKNREFIKSLQKAGTIVLNENMVDFYEEDSL